MKIGKMIFLETRKPMRPDYAGKIFLSYENQVLIRAIRKIRVIRDKTLTR